MKQRVLSGLIMAPLLIVIFFGGWVLFAGVLVISMIAAHEFSRSFKDQNVMDSILKVSIVFIYIAIGLFYLPFVKDAALNGNFISPTELLLLLAALFLIIVLVKSFGSEGFDITPAALTYMGIIYTGIFASFVLLIDQQFSWIRIYELTSSDGNGSLFWINGFNSYVWIVVLSAFGCDIFAYFTGYFFGKKKLCPNISPKKTVAGAVGGVMGSILCCGLWGFFLIPEGFINCLIIGLVCGVTAQLGDLSASVMKRGIGIKDWGNLIPGHGGILDRFDSVLFTAPSTYIVLSLINIVNPI